MRGFVSLAAVAIIVVAGWVGIIVWLYKNPLDPLHPPLFDWTDGPFGGFFVITLLFGTNLVVVSPLLSPRQINIIAYPSSSVVSGRCAMDSRLLHQ